MLGCYMANDRNQYVLTPDSSNMAYRYPSVESHIIQISCIIKLPDEIYLPWDTNLCLLGESPLFDPFKYDDSLTQCERERICLFLLLSSGLYGGGQAVWFRLYLGGAITMTTHWHVNVSRPGLLSNMEKIKMTSVSV